jgi:hypothetical protein
MELKISDEKAHIVRDWVKRGIGTPPRTASDLLADRATMLARMGELEGALKERDIAYGYAVGLLTALAPQCSPLPDLLGVLTQIDNATVWTKKLEASLATLRAERDALRTTTMKQADQKSPTAFEDKLFPGSWRIEFFDEDGTCELATFSGPSAKVWAERFATLRSGSVAPVVTDEIERIAMAAFHGGKCCEACGISPCACMRAALTTAFAHLGGERKIEPTVTFTPSTGKIEIEPVERENDNHGTDKPVGRESDMTHHPTASDHDTLQDLSMEGRA